LLRIDNLFHQLNWLLCTINFRLKNHEKSSLYQDFKNDSVLIFKNYIDKDLISEIKDSLEDEINKSNIFKAEDLELTNFETKKINRFLVTRHNIFKNSQLFYKYPSKYLEEVSMVKDPLKNIKKLSKTVNSQVISLVRKTMRSNVEIVKVWAYRTENDNNPTENFNGKFHTDGDHSKSLKCIVYLSDVNMNSGPFAYLDKNNKEVFICEKKGTVIFFRSSNLLHKGTNTINNTRHCLSFLVQPSFKDKLEANETFPQFQRKTFPFLPLSKDIIFSNNL